MGKGKRKREETPSVDSSTYPPPIKMKDRHKAILLDLIGDVVSGIVEIDGRPSGRAFWENLTISLNSRIQNRRRRRKPFDGYAALEVVSCARELKEYYTRHKNDDNPPENIEQFQRAFGGGKLLSIPSANTMLGLISHSCDSSCDRRSITNAEMVIVDCIADLRADNCISVDEAMYGGTHLNSAGQEIKRALFMRLRVQDQIAYIKKIFNEKED